MLRTITIVLIVLLGTWKVVEVVSSSGQGDTYPSRPIHVVVPYTAGGETDAADRSYAQPNQLLQWSRKTTSFTDISDRVGPVMDVARHC